MSLAFRRSNPFGSVGYGGLSVGGRTVSRNGYGDPSLPMQTLQARPMAPTPRPIYNGPLGGYGPNGFQAGDGVLRLRAEAQRSVSPATGLPLRANSALRGAGRRPWVYGATDAWDAAYLDAISEGKGDSSARAAADAATGKGGGGKGAGLLNVLDKLAQSPLVAGLLGGKKQSQSTYVPVAPSYTPPPSSMPSWAAPVIAVGALGAVGALIYAFVK